MANALRAFFLADPDDMSVLPVVEQIAKGGSPAQAEVFFDPGFDPAWRSLLARRTGRVVFAGEHTSERWQGYMNGAVESGQRAARALIAEQAA